jgi:WD40 repeat protein
MDAFHNKLYKPVRSGNYWVVSISFKNNEKYYSDAGYAHWNETDWDCSSEDHQTWSEWYGEAQERNKVQA